MKYMYVLLNYTIMEKKYFHQLLPRKKIFVQLNISPSVTTCEHPVTM